jgi:hypothetical protein
MSDNKKKVQSQEPDFEGGTKEIKTHFFYYGKGMQQKCLTSSKKFIDHIGSKFGESVKQSIEENRLVVTEIKEPKLYKTEKEFTDESWSVQQAHKLDTADYQKYVQQISVDLSRCYSILWQQCNLALQTVVKRGMDFIQMNAGDVKSLYDIIQRVC